MIYLKLFWSFFQVGLFSIGGGYAAMPIIQNQVVDTNGWLSLKEFADVITISQMTPGPVAINSASFVGIRIAGIAGALIATAGCVFPSCCIVLLLGTFYYKYRNLSLMQGILKGLRPAVIALIGSAGFTLAELSLWGDSGMIDNVKGIDFASLGLFLAAFFVLRKWKINPTLVMLGTGIAGLCVFAIAFWL